MLTLGCNNEDLMAFIETLRGEVKNHVVRKTNYVIKPEEVSKSRKIEMAKKYGVKTITEKQLLDMLNLPTD